MSEVHPFKLTVVTKFFSNLQHAQFFLTAFWNLDVIVVCMTSGEAAHVKTLRTHRLRVFIVRGNKVEILHKIIRTNPFDTYWFAWFDMNFMDTNPHLQSYYIQTFKPELKVASIREIQWDSRLSFILGTAEMLEKLAIDKTEDFLFEESEPISVYDFMKPIITPTWVSPVLTGDLGNQMFQVASVFGISQTSQTHASIILNPGNEYCNTMFRNFFHGKISYQSSLVEYDTESVNEHLYDIHTNSIIYGNLNVPKYFERQQQILMRLFSFKSTRESFPNTVFIYIPKQHMKNCSVFINKALKHCSTLIPGVKYKSFSDDSCQYETISKMLSCEFGGISFEFSTLAWWAVYLNPNPKSLFITNHIHPNFIYHKCLIPE